MISYDKENQELSVIINSEAVIQNLSYKLDHDKNVINFFEDILHNIEHYEKLDRMVQYDFVNDIKEMRKILSGLYRALQADYIIKGKTAAELAKCCSIFPDNIGRRMLRQISYLPLIDLFYERILYFEYIKKEYDLEKKFCGYTHLEDQEHKLFKESIRSVRFPANEDFIDYKMRNRHIAKTKKEYGETRLAEIETAMELLIIQYHVGENRSEMEDALGAIYWDNKNELRVKEAKKFGEILEKMVEAWSDKEDSK